jgi:mannose-6-phosphate isomerase-like protein (cupin superfamily)
MRPEQGAVGHGKGCSPGAAQGSRAALSVYPEEGWRILGMDEGKRPIEEFQGVIVSKPWGYEYLMYQNGIVALWYLHIEHGCGTSMHCHPRKKTGLILISGEARVSFLNDSMNLKALSKLMIRAGLFHSTSAVSPEGIALLEVENPCDKANLVRLEDKYGRKEQPYEGRDAIRSIDENCVLLERPETEKEFRYNLHGCVFRVEKSEDISILKNRSPQEVIVILEGGLASRTGEPVLGAGDVVSAATLDRLAQTFYAPAGASVLSIRKSG